MEVDPHVSTSWDLLPAETHPLTHSLPHLFIYNPLPLSNSHEQGRTLQLERERMEEGIEGGKGEEEEKHQHPPMDLINISNPIMVSSRDWLLFCGFSPNA